MTCATNHAATLFPGKREYFRRPEISRWELLITFFLFLILSLIYSAGQEKIAFNYPHDDYYFILRSDDYDLHGNHLAYAREYLYSLFISISRVLGLGLRNTEVLCFSAALFWLWKEVLNLSGRRQIAWVTLLPLLFFTYQHPVFNRATYDALQLVLTPLVLASSLRIVTRNDSLHSLGIAGFIVGLQALTRPEGALFALAPIAALFSLLFIRSKDQGLVRKAGRLLCKLFVFALVPLTMVQCVSAYNYFQHGFWAVTIMKSEPFRASLRALMSIDPQNPQPDPYGSLPISSMRKAFDSSPSFRATKAFFVDHLNGAGWSGFAHYNYRAIDGSVSGGHTQWAWFEAVATVAGSTPREMLAYHSKVAEELNQAFEQGILPKREILTPSFGAEFSPFKYPFFHSLQKLFFAFFHFNDPFLPERASRASNERVERDYDWLALRRKALIDDQQWQKLGWIADPSKGLPLSIALDTEAIESKIVLELLNRPDVAQTLFPQTEYPDERQNAGFLLIIRGNASGNILVQYETDSTPIRIPIQNLRNIQPHHTYTFEGTQVRIDDDYGNSGFATETDRWVMGISRNISGFLHVFMKYALFATLIWLVMRLFVSRQDSEYRWLDTTLWIVVVISLSLFIPRWMVLAALDSGITPGHEPRYMAAGAFALWFLATFTIAHLISYLCQRYLYKNLDFPEGTFGVD